MSRIQIQKQLLRRCRCCIIIIIVGLFISGVTAFPLESELRYLSHSYSQASILHDWLMKVYTTLAHVNHYYPFLSYGTDWLAFAHVLLAILFIGPLYDPVKNIWVIRFGLIACALILPLAFIAGGIRHIPVFWRLIDCSFGVFAAIPLSIAWFSARAMQALQF